MPLPSSGTISMNDIRIELGVPTQSPFSLDTARSGGYVTLNVNSPTLPPSTGQVSLADWYSYCQGCATYTFSYNDTSALACLNNDPITIISNTIPIGVGSLLYLGDYSPAFTPYYYSDGSNWWYAEQNGSEQTEVTSTGSCSGTTYNLFYADEYVCDGIDCAFVQSGVLVALDNTITPSYSNYYVPQAGGTQIFQLTSSTPTGPGVILSTTSYASCIEICGV